MKLTWFSECAFQTYAAASKVAIDARLSDDSSWYKGRIGRRAGEAAIGAGR
jgi:hypothetical protein